MAPTVNSPLPLRFPSLIFAGEPDGDDDDESNKKDSCGGGGGRSLFLSLLDGRTYPLESEMITGRSCLGTSYGWLLTWIPGRDANLVHPFTGYKIDLPSISQSVCEVDRRGYIVDDDGPTDPEYYFIRSVVLTDSPWIDGVINPNCIVVILIGWCVGVWSCKLADCNTNQTAAKWTEVDPTKQYLDIVYHKGNIYAMNQIGEVYHIENYDGAFSQKGKMVYKGVNACVIPYLVSSISGDLLIVERSHGGAFYSSAFGEDEDPDDENRYVTVGFVVRKLVAVEDEGRVVRPPRYMCESERVHNLRTDEALFIGRCSSSSVSLADAEGGMLKPNCIYFTDNNLEFFPTAGGGHDLGVFNLTDATVTSYYTYTGKKSLSHSCPPLWYI